MSDMLQLVVTLNWCLQSCNKNHDKTDAYRTIKNPLPVLLVAGLSKSLCAFLSSARQRRKHVRQPVTSVVVMPICCVGVNVGSKHCTGLITDELSACQTYLSASLLPISALGV